MSMKLKLLKIKFFFSKVKIVSNRRNITERTCV